MERRIVHPGGRPLTLNTHVIDDLCGYFRRGMSAVDACALAGVQPARYLEWMRIGRAVFEEDHKYPKLPTDPEAAALYLDLYQRVPMARARIRSLAMMTIVKHASPRKEKGENGEEKIVPGDFNAAKWVMEHTSDDYAPTGKSITRHESHTEIAADIRVRVELDETDVEHARKVAVILANAGADAAAIGLLPDSDTVDGEYFTVDEDSEAAASESVAVHPAQTD